MSRAFVYIIFFITACTPCSLFTQESEAYRASSDHVPVSSLENVTEQLDYSKTTSRLELKQKYRDMLLDQEDLEIQETQRKSLGIGGFMEIFAYILIFILIGFILYIVFANIQTDTKIQLSDTETAEIEDIETVNARSGYEEALAIGDYRSAVRMQFILVLQYLSNQRKIDWHPNKTNRDYARELRTSNHHAEFRQMSNIFEWVWYGHTDISEPVFQDVNRHFTSFIDKYVPPTPATP